MQLKKWSILVLVASMLFVSVPVAAMDVTTKVENANKAAALSRLGIIDAVSTNYLFLRDPLNREEGITLLLRLFGLLDDANSLSDQEVDKILATVSDKNKISFWAKKNVAYAIQEQISLGVDLQSANDTSTRNWNPKGNVDVKTFVSWISYKLGHHIHLQNPVTQLKSLAGAPIPYIYTFQNNKLMNRDMAIGLMYDSLTAKFANQNTTVIESLISKGKVNKNDAVALGLIPNQPEDPVIGGTPIDNTAWLASTGMLVEWNDQDGTIIYDLPYGTSDRHKYDLYIPANLDNTEDLGVVLFIHGGAWNSGDKGDISYMNKRVTKEGFISASMNYSLADGNTPDYSINKVMNEIQQAVSAIKQELENRGYQVNKLAIGGHSAGGHLSSLYAYSRADVSPIPVVLEINQAGPIDFDIKTWRGVKLDDHSYSAWAEYLSSLLGVQITVEQLKNGEAQELVNSISPEDHINSTSVPTVFAYGAKDEIVNSIHYKRLEVALIEAGVDHKFIFYPHSGHGLEGDKIKANEFIRTMFAYLNKYFEIEDGEPTSPGNGGSGNLLVVTSDLMFYTTPDSMFPGSTIKLTPGGDMTLTIPGLAAYNSVYVINGHTIDVAEGGGHTFNYVERNGEYKITVSAAGGSVTLDFYTDAAKFNGN